VLDFLLLALLAGRSADERFSAAYEQRLAAMLVCLASIMDAGGNVPMIGDADDGAVTRLAQSPDFSTYRSLLASGAILFGSGELKFLIGPGTCAYHGGGEWRAYFRGTAAHNTLRIDGVDQSLPGGDFMWVKQARARCDTWESSDAADVFEAWHDGYLRLSDPVLHRRRITLDKRARRVVIEDRL